MISRQFVITVAAGKRLIAKAIVKEPAIQDALKSGTIVIVAGTTNGYIVEELFSYIGIDEDFKRNNFFRGITVPPLKPVKENGRMPDESGFPGDVILVNGTWKKGLTIFDVIDDLKEGDIILKGANALDLNRRKAAVLIGDLKAGTIGAAFQAVVGRRVRLILPVGAEKRVIGDLDDLAIKLNTPGAMGHRLMPVPGQVVTELDAISMLTNAKAELIAAGGVHGAEGGIRLLVSGKPEQFEEAVRIIKTVENEPPFE
jgi:hypothetical protein